MMTITMDYREKEREEHIRLYYVIDNGVRLLASQTHTESDHSDDLQLNYLCTTASEMQFKPS